MGNDEGTSKFPFFKFPSHEGEPDWRAQWARTCARIEQVTEKPWEPKNDV